MEEAEKDQPGRVPERDGASDEAERAEADGCPPAGETATPAAGAEDASEGVRTTAVEGGVTGHAEAASPDTSSLPDADAEPAGEPGRTAPQAIGAAEGNFVPAVAVESAKQETAVITPAEPACADSASTPQTRAAELSETAALTETPEDSADTQLLSAEELLPATPPATASGEDVQLKALLEAVVYVTEEPLSVLQIATAINQPRERLEKILDELVAEYDKPEHGLSIRQVAGGFKMTTKAEHHEAVRNFVRSLKPPLKLSLAALETLAVIAYKQPITAPEIMDIRGVQGAGVLKTLLDRKLIAAAGRKNVIGKPILYKTTKEFLVQFGLKDLTELPSLKEFEEIRRLAISDEPTESPAAAQPAEEPLAEAPLPHE